MIAVNQRVSCRGIDAVGVVLSLYDKGYISPMATVRFDDDHVPVVVEQWKLTAVPGDQDARP